MLNKQNWLRLVSKTAHPFQIGRWYGDTSLTCKVYFLALVLVLVKCYENKMVKAKDCTWVLDFVLIDDTNTVK